MKVEIRSILVKANLLNLLQTFLLQIWRHPQPTSIMEHMAKGQFQPPSTQESVTNPISHFPPRPSDRSSANGGRNGSANRGISGRLYTSFQNDALIGGAPSSEPTTTSRGKRNTIWRP